MRRTLSALQQGSRAGWSGVTSWTVALETPSYEFREADEDRVAYYCKSSKTVFTSPKEFLLHAEGLTNKSRDDMIFEEVARDLGLKEEKEKEKGKAKAEEEGVGQPENPWSKGIPEDRLRSSGPTVSLEEVEARSTPKGYRIAARVTAPDLELQLLQPITPDTLPENVRLLANGRPILGPTEIRRSLMQLSFTEPASNTLVMYMKTYIPSTPRPGYSLANAVTLVTRKVQYTTAVKRSVNTQASRLPPLPDAAVYLCGSSKERESLAKVIPTPSGNTVEMTNMFSPQPGTTVNVEECSVKGTPDSPVVVTPAGDMTLSEFVKHTNTQQCSTSPFVQMARRLLATQWATSSA